MQTCPMAKRDKNIYLIIFIHISYDLQYDYRYLPLIMRNKYTTKLIYIEYRPPLEMYDPTGNFTLPLFRRPFWLVFGGNVQLDSSPEPSFSTESLAVAYSNEFPPTC